MPVNVTHTSIREVEQRRVKLRNQAAEKYDEYNACEDKSSDVAQTAFQEYRKISDDLDKVQGEAMELLAQVQESSEMAQKEARHREFEIDNARGLNPEESDDPDAPNPSLSGSVDPYEDEAYRQAFWAMRRNEIPGEHRSHRNFVTAEHRDILAQVEQRGLQAGVAAKGKNAVPTTMASTLVEFLKFGGPVVPGGGLCYEFSTESGAPYEVPTIDDTAQSGNSTASETNRLAKGPDAGLSGSVGAIKTDYVGPGNDPTFGKVTFGATMYDSSFIPVTYEMLMDTAVADLERQLGMLLGKRLGRTINAAFTGVIESGVPSGNLLRAASKTAITPDELVEMPHEIDPAYRGVNSFAGAAAGNHAVMINDSTYKEIRLMKVPHETSGSTPYLFTPTSNILAGNADTLLGVYPVYLNSAMSGTATGKKSVLMGDFSNVWIRNVRGVQMVTSSELFIQNLLMAYMAWQRCDCKVVVAGALGGIDHA